MERVYNVGEGQIRESDIPEVVRESNLSQTWRFGITFGVFALVCLMMIVSLERHERGNPGSAISEPSLENEVYRDMEAIHYVVGSRIQISSDEDMEIQYISPELLGDTKWSGSVPVLFANVHERKNLSNDFTNPIMAVLKRGDSGSIYELNLTKDEAITRIAILGSDTQSALKNLSTAKVIIRDVEGKKVWQSCQFLKPDRLNIVNIRTS